jgi:NADH-quinone oxidoreductase subunit N
MNPEFKIELLSQYTAQASPLLFLLAVGLLLMLMDAFKAHKLLPWVAGAGFAGSAFLALFTGAPETVSFGGMIAMGGQAGYIHAALCGAGFLSLFFMGDYMDRYQRYIPDLYTLLTFAVVGMTMMANARDLIMVFIGLETMSICLYVFAAAYKTDVTSNESGLKYFLLGAFSSAFLLFGIALLYGLTGATSFTGLAAARPLILANPSIFLVGLLLLLTGFLFKLAAFPFHNWAPDVYQGAPTPLAGFMATASKMATFISLATLARVLELDTFGKATTLIIFLAVLTMVYANIVAARQTNLKRLMAYSGIAHTGYVLLAICAGADGYQAVVFYTIIYTLMTIGAFAMIGMAEKTYEDTEQSHWAGLGQKTPLFAGAFSLFLFSLAGIPPLAGFMSKYLVFAAAIDAGFIWAAIIGILSSVVGAYYYLRVVHTMYFGKSESALTPTMALAPRVGIAILAALVVLLGVMPSLGWM